MSKLSLSSTTNFVTVPAMQDVLCGRRDGFLSLTYQTHPGNQIFKAMIRENKPLCQTMSLQPTINTDRKRMLVSSIIGAIQQHGGRFLRKHGRQWAELSEDAVFAQTLHALEDGERSSSPCTQSAPPQCTRKAIRQRRPPQTRQHPSPMVPITVETASVDEVNFSNGYCSIPETILDGDVPFWILVENCFSESSSSSLSAVPEMSTTPCDERFTDDSNCEDIPALIHSETEDENDLDPLDFAPTTTTMTTITHHATATTTADDWLPLDPHHEFHLSDSSEFSSLCGDLLEWWGLCVSPA
jgi:hypothetical protein